MNSTQTRSAAIFLTVIICFSGYYAWHLYGLSAPTPEEQASPIQQSVPKADQVPAPVKRQSFVPRPAETAIPLPDLDSSDKIFEVALLQLLNRKALPSLFYTGNLIRRFVATVDNLPRRHAPVRVWPVKRTANGFVVSSSVDGLVIAPLNAARYGIYIEIIQSFAVPALVDLYVRFYPLFQQAYQELGYPKGYFNNRLIESIDDLLAAPEFTMPIRLLQPKVLYEFADPDLEGLSSGQKVMLRIGSSNAAIVKAKLRTIRSEVLNRLSNK